MLGNGIREPFNFISIIIALNGQYEQYKIVLTLFLVILKYTNKWHKDGCI